MAKPRNLENPPLTGCSLLQWKEIIRKKLDLSETQEVIAIECGFISNHRGSPVLRIKLNDGKMSLYIFVDHARKFALDKYDELPSNMTEPFGQKRRFMAAVRNWFSEVSWDALEPPKPVLQRRGMFSY